MAVACGAANDDKAFFHQNPRYDVSGVGGFAYGFVERKVAPTIIHPHARVQRMSRAYVSVAIRAYVFEMPLLRGF